MSLYRNGEIQIVRRDQLKLLQEIVSREQLALRQLLFLNPLLSFQNANSEHSKELNNTPNMHYDIDYSTKLPGPRTGSTSSGVDTLTSPGSEYDNFIESPLSSPVSDREDSKWKNPDVIMYQGRNLLDLYHNMTYQWDFQMAVLPSHGIDNHFNCRSLYHRLGAFGLVEELASQKCCLCDFEYVIPKYQN